MLGAAALEEFVRLDRLGPALAEATGTPSWATPRVSLIAGGKSNLTFALTSGVRELVFRRPPTGDLLHGAHDMVREARIQQALAATDVPTAQIVLIDDGDLLGFPFYVMEKVPGHVIRDALPPGFAEHPEQRMRLAHAFVDTLAILHAVDHHAVGLDTFGRPEGFLSRQVRRWAGRWEASRFEPVPAVEKLGARLAASVPPQKRASIVHGDYRLDNVVVHPTEPGTITAVLDWELSTLGDPMTDLALLLMFWRSADEPELSLTPGVSHLPGFPPRTELLARYAAASNLDVSDIDWYLAFAHFKFACIAQGVASRARAGAMAGQTFGDLQNEIVGLGERGMALL